MSLLEEIEAKRMPLIKAVESRSYDFLNHFGWVKRNQLGKKGSTMMKPRLNQISLHQMAKRHATSIQASAYSSELLSRLTDYLLELADNLKYKEHSPEELVDIETTLEAIEAALKHLWISPPYNEALTTPRALPKEQILRLKTILKKAQRKNHLRIAYSRKSA